MAKKTLDPWGSELVEDYEKIIKDFGLEVFDSTQFPDPNHLMRRQVVFAGRDFELILKAINKNKKFYTLTGIMPSADKIHFGNKMAVENLIYFQQQGAETYILVADLEAAAARGISLADARKRALEFHIPAYITLGLDPKKTKFYFQSENTSVTNLASEFSKKITESEFKAIYGNADPGKIFSSMIQAGDIMFPQLKEPMPGIIPTGIDQEPHIRLTRDIARRTKSVHKFFLPSSIYHKYSPSLDGEMKMSKSRPESCLELPEDMATVKKKIMRAKTGGRDTIEEQKKLGGQPEKCMVFELYKQHLIEDDAELQKIYDECKAGKLTCGEDKKHCVNLMKKFMKFLEDGIKKNRKVVEKLGFIKF